MIASPGSSQKPPSDARGRVALLTAQRVSRIASIAALYAATTLVCLLFLGSLAWGPIQFRLSEALCVLALLSPDAVPGLALGCAVANIANIAVSGTGMLGMLDVVFGSLATLVGAWCTWRLRRHPRLAVLGPVVANALIVPAYLPLMLKGIGFYTIPFTSISLDDSYALMYLFGLLATGIGEAVVLYVLGLPLWRALLGSPLVRDFAAREDTAGGGRTSIGEPPVLGGGDATGGGTDRHVTERI
ncbi:QueT transporter family protein [Olsenella sp. oral taxon 807]|uniref:QueT transporter family protein n=1 Tax=Olsenella sp. oral taxon 807 TaxID=712411 RepID=UPI0009F94ED8